MEITTDLVKNLANLSRLNFTDSEIEFFKAEFTKNLRAYRRNSKYQS